ncbi:MAG: DUF4367 domain-containing protein [Clostridia bacterium]|nr:DUF4367 domain-containing protein [Clostridia bacterium]
MSKNLYKHPKLYEAFDLYCQQWCNDLPTDEELEAITFSPSFEEKMRRILRRQKCGYYVLFGTVGRCVASVVLSLLVGMTITTFSVKALREPVVRFITEVFESFTSILFVNDEPAESEIEMNPVVPAYIPEGYVLESENKTGILYRVVYHNAELDADLVFTQRSTKSGNLGTNTEDVEYHPVTVNGLEGVAYTQNDSTAIIFSHNNYTFTIKGPLSEEELLHIAASIPLE